MTHFTIKDIENLCGIKAHTLRIWEQRYQLFVPKRKESQHRIYDCEDLKTLLRISFLYHNGYKISKIAKLNAIQIRDEVSAMQVNPCNYEIYVHQLIEASLKFDEKDFEKIVNDLVLHIGLEKSIFSVFYPFLKRIGMLWMTNHVVPAQEHFSSYIIQKKIIAGIDKLEINKIENTNIVIFSPVGEMHELPLLVVNYLLKKNGVSTTYFGINVSVEALVEYSQQHSISHFYSNIITHLDSCGMDDSICLLCKHFPDIPFMLSGPAGNCVQKIPANLNPLRSLDEIILFTNSFKNY